MQVVDRLGDDRAAAEDGREVEAEERHDRDQRGAQNVLDEDPARREPLRLRSAHEVLVDRVEDVRAQDAPVKADEEHSQREPGQDQVVEPLGRILGQRDVLAVREPRDAASFTGEEVAKEQPQPGDR